MKNFSVRPTIYATSWISVVILLWGMVTGFIDSTFVSWFAFVFFIVTPILIYATEFKK